MRVDSTIHGLYDSLLLCNPIILQDLNSTSSMLSATSIMIYLVNATLPEEVLVIVHVFILLHHQSCSNLASNSSSPNDTWLCQTKRALSSSSNFNPLWLILVKGGRMHLIPSAIALTPYYHLVQFAASSG